ncbi:TIGR01777 family oxidoreductase [Nocardia brevicatena]|uniref:TIGR01777 family oxidoreductase n=1 Tax=Nocardia brevicatena TaxID=37327 RepID=UPI0003068024|nr:TIGR01777 family oxidoreductase [Nocardia brevicatena]
MKHKRVVVTGATGTVGKALCRRLADRGDQVVAFARNTTAARASLGPEPTYVCFDLGSDGSWTEALEGADAVVNLAGATLFKPFTGRRYLDNVTQQRIEGSRRLAAAIARTTEAPKVLVQASSVGVYGFGALSDEPVTEQTSAYEGVHSRGSAAWEATAEISGIRAVLIRMGYVLARDGGGLPHQIQRFRSGKEAYFAPGTQWSSWIHIDDLVSLILCALDDETMAGPYNCVSPTPVRAEDFAGTLAAVVGANRPRKTPSLLAHVILGAGADIVLRGRRVVPERLQAMEFRFQYPTLDPAIRSLTPESHSQSGA